MSTDRQSLVKEILHCLNARRIRATYGAVGGVIGVHPRGVGNHLGARRPEASWVVRKKGGKPTGYGPGETHPKLCCRARVIDNCDDLETLLQRCRNRQLPPSAETKPERLNTPYKAARQLHRLSLNNMGDRTVNERDRNEIKRAIESLAAADRILDGIEPPDGDSVPPWVAAHVWTFRAMSLLIDTLNGVEEVTFSDDEQVPVAVTQQPYSYLASEYNGWSERARKMAEDHEGQA